MVKFSIYKRDKRFFLVEGKPKNKKICLVCKKRTAKNDDFCEFCTTYPQSQKTFDARLKIILDRYESQKKLWKNKRPKKYEKTKHLNTRISLNNHGKHTKKLD